jgi:hypothetical protein
VKRRGFLAGLVGAIGLGAWGKLGAPSVLRKVYSERVEYQAGARTDNRVITHIDYERGIVTYDNQPLDPQGPSV